MAEKGFFLMAQSQNSVSLHDTEELKELLLPRVAIVYTEWNHKIVRELVNGCESMLHRFGGDIITKMPVPGSFEIPFACREIWKHFESDSEYPEAKLLFRLVLALPPHLTPQVSAHRKLS